MWNKFNLKRNQQERLDKYLLNCKNHIKEIQDLNWIANSMMYKLKSYLKNSKIFNKSSFRRVQMRRRI
jgi:hypothetical protein